MAMFLLTLPALALQATLNQVDQVLAGRAERLQDNVWLLPYDQDLADAAHVPAEAAGIMPKLHLLQSEPVPMTGRMRYESPAR